MSEIYYLLFLCSVFRRLGAVRFYLRCDATSLRQTLDDDLALIEERGHWHTTPSGSEQRSQSSMSDASKTSPMPMAMMKIRIVQVLMPNGLMPMPMGMRFCYRRVMSVLMMFVVNVAMIVF
jgi:hypothetical protein